ncbi:MAG TPA: hypothetical protein VFS10_23405 [Pyrinomonadaceae bacterium]|nr:hypothetical protein [Pyrinomonadaceae bacterium]
MSQDEEMSALSELLGPGESTPRRFSAGELVACGECARANPPTRMNCIYCGAALPVTAESEALRRPTLRKLEEWENGFNLVLSPRREAKSPSPEALAEAADLLRLEAAQLSACVEAGTALPVARAATLEEAQLIERRLRALGLSVEAVSDEELGASKMPKRIRALEITDDELVGWGGPEEDAGGVAWGEVELFVAGRIFTKRLEVEEVRKRLKGRQETIDAREMLFDEAVLDIFHASDEGGAGWRIMAESFDYSCLGARKGLLARDNFNTLVETLRARALTAEFDEDYVRLRHLLAAVWPLAERTESLGLRRSRPGRLSTEAVTTASNEMQFTRYARLRQVLARKGRKRLT